MSEIILENDNYEISYWHRGSVNVTIVFSSAGALALAQPIEEFKNTIKKFDTSYIFVKSKHLDWYNNINSIKTLKFLANFCKKYQYTFVLGESLGGSGAILFSKYYKNITRILSFSPQYSALPAFCKWNGPLTPLDGVINTFAFSDYAPQEAKSKSILIYPTQSYEDNLHASFFKSNGFNVIFIETKHHDIARHLKKDYSINYLDIILESFYNITIDYSTYLFESILFDIVERNSKVYVKWIANQTFRYDVFIDIPDIKLISKHGEANQSSVCEYSFNRENTNLEAQRAIEEPLRMIPAFHTAFEKKPWWSIDLRKKSNIKQIIIYNRCDNEEFSRRFSKFSLLKSDDGLYWVEFYRKTEPYYIGGEYGEPFQLDTNITARFIKIILNKTDYLHLSKVEIYGDREMDEPLFNDISS